MTAKRAAAKKTTAKTATKTKTAAKTAAVEKRAAKKTAKRSAPAPKVAAGKRVAAAKKAAQTSPEARPRTSPKASPKAGPTASSKKSPKKSPKKSVRTTAKTAPPRKAAAKKAAPATQAAPAKTAKRAAAPAAVGTTPPSRPPRRTIFIDVENTSHQDELERVLDKLDIDREREHTQLIGVGNWRLIGQRLARRLASLGAHLVHSAPVSGVRDWSDLWIAVSAGIQLGHAVPGDALEIVSSDRAFDAVGDTAAALGVAFRRIPVAASATAATTDDDDETKPARRRRRPRKRGAKRAAAAAPREAVVSEDEAPPSRPPAAPRERTRSTEEPHGASHEQITSVLTRLAAGDPDRWINLDILEKALKEEGYSRPAGSPRLVTRLRRFDDIEISPHGRVRLRESS